MNKPLSILKEKKGMTLVETVITFVIAGILIAATGALIIAGLNLYGDTASRTLDKQIGESVLDVATDALKYSKSITAAGTVDSTSTAGAIFVGTNPSTPTLIGKLYMKKADDPQVFSVYPEDTFYSGREISLYYKVEQTGANVKAITLTVKVFEKVSDEYEQRFTKSTTMQLLNSTLDDEPKEYKDGYDYGPGKVLVFTPNN